MYALPHVNDGRTAMVSLMLGVDHCISQPSASVSCPPKASFFLALALGSVSERALLLHLCSRSGQGDSPSNFEVPDLTSTTKSGRSPTIH